MKVTTVRTNTVLRMYNNLYRDVSCGRYFLSSEELSFNFQFCFKFSHTVGLTLSYDY